LPAVDLDLKASGLKVKERKKLELKEQGLDYLFYPVRTRLVKISN
jgi:hypothetical protein